MESKAYIQFLHLFFVLGHTLKGLGGMHFYLQFHYIEAKLQKF